MIHKRHARTHMRKHTRTQHIHTHTPVSCTSEHAQNDTSGAPEHLAVVHCDANRSSRTLRARRRDDARTHTNHTRIKAHGQAKSGRKMEPHIHSRRSSTESERCTRQATDPRGVHAQQCSSSKSRTTFIGA
eukprot:EC813776.1.p2 GENE.EC813776.1~~EC813776.1.p2  ORF type:complete len:131 (-),score=22.56 EC813776.1:171-563(-)